MLKKKGKYGHMGIYDKKYGQIPEKSIKNVLRDINLRSVGKVMAKNFFYDNGDGAERG